jgi:hypothetical protein
MATVHAIEVADGDDRAQGRVGKVAAVPVDRHHAPGFERETAPQSAVVSN